MSAEARSNCWFKMTWNNAGRTNAEMTINAADTTPLTL